MEKIDIEELRKKVKGIDSQKDIYINLSGMINMKLKIKKAKFELSEERINIDSEEQLLSIETRFIKKVLADEMLDKIELQFDCYQTILIEM